MGIKTFCCNQEMEYTLHGIGTNHTEGYHFWDFEEECKICGKHIVGTCYDYLTKSKEEDIT